MPWNRRLFRLSATVAIGALLTQSVLPVAAYAQSVSPVGTPPPLPPADGTAMPPDQSQADPPERVGRIAQINGNASFHEPGDTQWSPANVNFPVIAGNAFWTQPGSRMMLEMSDSRIALAGGTQFDVQTLDANGLQGVADQGEIYLRLANLQSGEAWTVQTPRGLVRFEGPGRYSIMVGTTADPTLVTVLEGGADIEGPNLSLHVATGQTASITGTDTFQANVEPMRQDPFVTGMLEAERPPAPPPEAQPVAAAVLAMPGGSDLIGTGSWAEVPDYGPVWYPPVSPGWVPYRNGHWAYVAPWGWTWIDEAPWGFAPFHYGRWIEAGGRWCWTPGVVHAAAPPVYAPALVTFIGLGAGAAIGAGLASGHVGWVPLGPREPYRPWYHASDRYLRQVNVMHVTNVTNINNVTVNNFVNRRAVTVVPAAAMAASRPIAAIARPVDPAQLTSARPVFGQQPVRPTLATAGVTPAVARQFSLPAGPRPTAPGPVIHGPGPEAMHGFHEPMPGANPPPVNAAVRPLPTVQTPGPVPQIQRPVPPMRQNPVPSMTQNPVPPMTQNPVPSMTQNPVPSMTQNPVPPMTQNPVPPMMQHTVAPPLPQAQQHWGPPQQQAVPAAAAQHPEHFAPLPQTVPQVQHPQHTAPATQAAPLPEQHQQHFAPPLEQHQQHFAPAQQAAMPLVGHPPPQQFTPPPQPQHFSSPPPPQHFSPPPPPQHFAAPPRSEPAHASPPPQHERRPGEH